ncbi:MAG: ABC transporter permease [Gemmatimonadota bacterium]|nr:MAG: ABC transporter permease [Gemmatimonadota bacterium]
MTGTLTLYLEFTRITFIKMLAYRLRYYTGIVTYLVFVAGNAFLFRAIYSGLPEGTVIGGFNEAAVVTYIAVAWIGRSLTFNNVDRELATQVTGGNIAQNLLKPIDIQAMTFFGALGEALFRFVLFTVPISIVIVPLFHVGAPDAFSGLAAALSFFLAFLINTAINFIVGTFALHLKSIMGLVRAKHVVMELLTGALIPLSFFPDSWRQVVEMLPFASITYVPVTIWMGMRQGEALVQALLVQVFWAVALYGLGVALWRHAIRRTTVQGG